MNWADIQDNIDNCDDSLVKEIFIDKKDGKNFRVLNAELKAYKQLGCPLPRLHPEARNAQRMKKRGANTLYRRTTEDGVEVWTPYSPDRPEPIYSEKGYQKLRF